MSRSARACPPEVDRTLLDDTPVARKVRTDLLTNPNYPNLGKVAETTSQMQQLLERLNVNGMSGMVSASVLFDIDSAVVRARDTVVVTYYLYSYAEKLPALSSPELKVAEVDTFLQSLKAKNNTLPAELVEALRAKAAAAASSAA